MGTIRRECLKRILQISFSLVLNSSRCEFKNVINQTCFWFIIFLLPVASSPSFSIRTKRHHIKRFLHINTAFVQEGKTPLGEIGDIIILISCCFVITLILRYFCGEIKEEAKAGPRDVWLASAKLLWRKDGPSGLVVNWSSPLRLKRWELRVYLTLCVCWLIISLYFAVIDCWCTFFFVFVEMASIKRIKA